MKSHVPYLAVWRGDSLLKITIGKIMAEVECVESTKQALIAARGVREGAVKEKALQLSPEDGVGVSQAKGGVIPECQVCL